MSNPSKPPSTIVDPIGLAITHIAAFVESTTGQKITDRQRASLFRAGEAVLWLSRAIEAHLDQDRALARRLDTVLHQLADDGCPNVGEH